MSIRVERSGPVWTVINSNPEARNAVDPTAAEELRQAFTEFDQDETALVAVFWGEGGSFCSGYDLKAASRLDEKRPLADLDFPPGSLEESVDGFGLPAGPMGPTRLELSKPVIAAIAGPAVAGGMELALWCDIRVMEESAYMGVYCRRWGVPLIDGGTVRLPRLVGEGRALDLILTGRQVMAEECLRIGLAEYVIEDGESRERAEDLAADIARFPQECLRSDRESVRSQHGLPLLAAMAQEWEISSPVLAAEGIAGAGRFARGAGRHGTFEDHDD